MFKNGTIRFSIAFIFFVMLAAGSGCSKVVTNGGAILQGSPTPTPSGSPTPTPAPGTSGAAPACSMRALVQTNGYVNPGVTVTALIQITGNATSINIGVQGGSASIQTLPFPVSALFTV